MNQLGSLKLACGLSLLSLVYCFRSLFPAQSHKYIKWEALETAQNFICTKNSFINNLYLENFVQGTNIKLVETSLGKIVRNSPARLAHRITLKLIKRFI
jgi:hypothetical protein